MHAVVQLLRLDSARLVAVLKYSAKLDIEPLYPALSLVCPSMMAYLSYVTMFTKGVFVVPIVLKLALLSWVQSSCAMIDLASSLRPVLHVTPEARTNILIYDPAVGKAA